MQSSFPSACFLSRRPFLIRCWAHGDGMRRRLPRIARAVAAPSRAWSRAVAAPSHAWSRAATVEGPGDTLPCIEFHSLIARFWFSLRWQLPLLCRRPMQNCR
ncbi:hypothetical protein DAI22_08g140666 [Oryza sativa Japonica Group]|nr:hypothetical protein DAI22_08g140666 [Oryza sativa Japonica Group]